LLIKWIDKDRTFDGLSTSRDMLKSNAVAITLLPIEENDFKGVVDLVRNQAIVWDEEGMGTTYEIVPIPEDMIDEVKNTDRFLLRQLLIMMNLLENSWKMKLYHRKKSTLL
jgi:translation elongation factor EF-G